jgi:hypothetical protein
VGHRDPGIGRHSNSGSDAGYNFKGDAGFHKGFRLLSASPKNERVAAFESDYKLSFPGFSY